MIEVWKDIKGYEGCYQISNFGNVKSLERKVKCKNHLRKVNTRILKQGKMRTGYLFVSLLNKSKGRSCTIHQLVAIHFICNPNNYSDVDHIDRNRLNNNVDNLRWISESSNVRNSKRCENSASKFNGVYWIKPLKKWRAGIGINGRFKHLGLFEDEEKAALKFNHYCISNKINRELNFLR